MAKYYILLLLSVLIWGANPAFGKHLVESMSPLLITTLRFLCISIILYAYLIITKQYQELKLNRKNFIMLSLLGFSGVTIHNGFLFAGLEHTTATNTALIESIGPTVTSILAFIFLGERLSKFGILGILISCFGAILIICRGSLNVLLTLNFNIGDILIVICEIAWSAYAIIGCKVDHKYSIVSITAHSSLIGCILCLPIGLATNSLSFYHAPDFEHICSFLYLVFFSGVFAFISWNLAVSKVGASKAGAFIYIIPIVGALIGIYILDEKVHPAQLIGGVIVILGVVIIVKTKIKNKENNNIFVNYKPNEQDEMNS